MLKVSAFYLEKQKSFTPKEIKPLSISKQKYALFTNPIFCEGFGYDHDSSANFSRAMSCFQQSSTSFANINPGS